MSVNHYKRCDKNVDRIKYVNYINQKLRIKYTTNATSYNDAIIDNLIYNKNSHYASVFRDKMLYDYLDEYLKRYYNRHDATIKLPKLSKYYINYLSFFLRPVFRDFYVNLSLKKYGENKAELYYYCQYGKKPIKDEDSCSSNYKENPCSTLLTEEVRKKIDKNSFINNSKNNHEISSLYIGDIEMKSGLHTFRDQQESILKILSEFDEKKFENRLETTKGVAQNIEESKRVSKSIDSTSNNKENENITVIFCHNLNKPDDSNGCSQANINCNELESCVNDNGETLSNPKIFQEGTKVINCRSSSDNNISRNLPINRSRNNHNHIYNFKPSTTTSSLEQIKNGLNKFLMTNKTRNVSGQINSNTNTKTQQEETTKNLTISELKHNPGPSFNLTKTMKNEFLSTNKNFFERVQNETLKALQKIKKSKLEFKHVSNEKQKISNNYDNFISNTISLNKNDCKINKSSKSRLNIKNTKNSILDEYLTLTYNCAAKMKKNENKMSLNFYPTNCPTETRRALQNDNCNSNLEKNKNNSLSPNSRENGNEKVFSQPISLNSFKNLMQQSQTLSRNKNTNLLGSQTTKNSIKNEKKQNSNYFSSMNSALVPSNNKTFLETPLNPYYSFKNEKSNIKSSQPSNLISKNIGTTNIEQLQERLFGTFESNYKFIKNILSESKEKVKKQNYLTENEKKKQTKKNNIYSSKVQYMSNDNLKNLNNVNLISSKSSINKMANGCSLTTQQQNSKLSKKINQINNCNLIPSKEFLPNKNQNPSTILKSIKTIASKNKSPVNCPNNKYTNQRTTYNTDSNLNKKTFFTKLNGGGLVLNQINLKEKKNKLK